ncbi:MAG: hypothetical protein N3D75_00695 [Candidatus Aenigmarchaeota archaeon]|nr:hypothetical protein [Candidatus Aenigmarchaeota archaeon]
MLELPENSSIKAIYLHDEMYDGIPSIHILFRYFGKDYPRVISCIFFEGSPIVTSQEIQCYNIFQVNEIMLCENNGYLDYFEQELKRKGYKKVDITSDLAKIFMPYSVKDIQEKIFSIFEEPSFG